MFNSNMDSLLNDSISHLLVDDDTDSSGVNVEDSASSSVIEAVGHAFMDSTINQDINVVTNSVSSEDL